MTNQDNSSSAFKTNPMAIAMTLKKQLRFYIERRGLTAAKLARDANVPKQSLSGWINGNNPRDVKQVKRVADALNISVDNLLFGDGEDADSARAADLGALLGNEWVSGTFELKIRRVKK